MPSNTQEAGLRLSLKSGEVENPFYRLSNFLRLRANNLIIMKTQVVNIVWLGEARIKYGDKLRAFVLPENLRD